MTILGKALVFLTLILGIGAAVFATSTYTQRPPYFTALPDGGIEKGQYPIQFAQLTAEIDSLGKAALVAHSAWNSGLKSVEASERVRGERYVKMFGRNPDGSASGVKGLLDIANEGIDPKDPDSPAFFTLKELAINPITGKDDPVVRWLDLDDRKDLVNGPNNKPLRGAGTLLTRFEFDSKAIVADIAKSAKLRDQQKTLGDEIVLTEGRIFKQQNIRDNLLNEAAHLAAFEVNATEHRETVLKRQQQLIRRLQPFLMTKP